MLERKYINGMVINAIKACNKKGVEVETISRITDIQYDNKTGVYSCRFLVNEKMLVKTEFLQRNLPFNDNEYTSTVSGN